MCPFAADLSRFLRLYLASFDREPDVKLGGVPGELSCEEPLRICRTGVDGSDDSYSLSPVSSNICKQQNNHISLNRRDKAYIVLQSRKTHTQKKISLNPIGDYNRHRK